MESNLERGERRSGIWREAESAGDVDGAVHGQTDPGTAGEMAVVFSAGWLGERSGGDINPDRCGGGEGSRWRQMRR
jgi:hypothetical protein